MPAIRLLKIMLIQTAVYWAPRTNELGEVVPADDGRPAFADPEEIKVFWMDSVTTEDRMMVPNSQAKVFVGRDVMRLGVLWKGTIEDLPQGRADDPLGVKDAGVIQKFVKTPTLTPGEYVRVAYL